MSDSSQSNKAERASNNSEERSQKIFTYSNDAIFVIDPERDHIIKALETTGWRVSGSKGAAKLLDIKPTTLEARIKKLGIKKKN